ncbi:unnamed protein product, partial [Discosporangium mesarthrocarpum]
TLENVRELHKRFREKIPGFALVEPQFECVLSFKPGLEAKVGAPLSTLFKKLDNDKDGRIDGLELISGLALCCRGDFEGKARYDLSLSKAG